MADERQFHPTDVTRGLGERIVQAMDRLFLCQQGLSPNERTWRPQREGARSLQDICIQALSVVKERNTTLKQRQRSEPACFTNVSEEDIVAFWTEERVTLCQEWRDLSERVLTAEYEPPQTLLLSADNQAVTGYDLLLNLLQYLHEQVGQAQILRDFLFLAKEDAQMFPHA